MEESRIYHVLLGVGFDADQKTVQSNDEVCHSLVVCFEKCSAAREQHSIFIYALRRALENVWPNKTLHRTALSLGSCGVTGVPELVGLVHDFGFFVGQSVSFVVRRRAMLDVLNRR